VRSESGGRIASLDGLRGVAIILVVISHILGVRLTQNFPDQIAFGLGSIGVDLFFVVSGFIITHLLLQERERAGSIDLTRFYERRAVRLWPALWAYLTVVCVLSAVGVTQVNLLGVLAPLLFFTDYVTSATSVVTVHTWSLACEEQFYLLWPCVLLLVPQRYLKRILVLAFLAAPLVRIGAYVVVPAWRGEAFFQFHDRYDMLALGCLLAVLYRESWPLIRACADRASVSLPCALFAVLAVDVIDAHLSTRLFLFLIGYSVQALALAVIVGVCVEKATTGAVGRALNARWLCHIGTISYSLYLWQMLFTEAAFAPFASTYLGALLALVAMFICAELSWRCLESPLVALRARLRPVTPVAAPPSTPAVNSL
jgi:peptidoglycan/LPS O-acetylase OafA/YrhL